MASIIPGTCDAEDCMKKIGENVLFVIERNFDTQLVVYTVELSPDKREIKGVSSYWTCSDNLADTSPMGDQAKKLFYGVSLERLKLGLYRMRLACASDERIYIDLHIKKTGKVVPKIVIHDKECTLIKIYTDLTRFPPQMNGLWAIGKFKDEMLSQQIEVDTSMASQLDFTSF